ncbi:MAG: hypothetical protein JNM89_15970 [Hyphomicrobiaceae bacterium]|nr:hypothetical protein [Hyphomicrobiaceae bacterium]
MKDELATAGQNQKVFDADEAAALLELSQMQRKFADAVLRGATYVKAAKLAGYSGEGNNLRSTASKVAKSPAVRQYMALAKSGGAAVPDDPADREELKRTLSRHLRGGDKATSIRAAEVIHRINAAELEEKSKAPDPPDVVLDKLSELGELGCCIAVLLARKHRLAWNPPTALAPDAEKRMVAELKTQMTEADRRRVEHFADLQNNFSQNFRANDDGSSEGAEQGRASGRGAVPASTPAPGPVGHPQFRKSYLR